MNRHALSAFLVLALVFILSSITASAQQPRAIPSNDNFGSAKAIKIGKNYSVPDIAAATNEAAEPAPSCKLGGGLIKHSVWFKFTLPENSFISLSTFGTLLLTPTAYDLDTVLAIYELTSGGLTERGCSDDNNGLTAAQLVFYAQAQTTYYVITGTFAGTAFLPESTLKLSTRMLDTKIEPPNADFELPLNSGGWTLNNGSNDQVVCLNVTYAPQSGSCAFRFTGTAGVTTKLTNTMTALPFVPRKNAFLSTVFFFRVVDTASLGSTKVRVIVSYGDGTPPTRQTVKLTGLASTSGYNSRQWVTILQSGKIASVKFEVKFASATGGLLVDTVSYNYSADPGTRGADGLLPLPPAAGEKQ